MRKGRSSEEKRRNQWRREEIMKRWEKWRRKKSNRGVDREHKEGTVRRRGGKG